MNTSLTLAFLAGLSGYFHCIGMCGGLAGGFFATANRHRKVVAVLLYHSLRIFGYVLLGAGGAMLGRVLAQAGITGKVQGLIQITAGLIIVGLGVYQIVKTRSKKHNHGAKCSGSCVTTDSSSQQYLLFAPALAGLINGLIPCALVFSIAVKATQVAVPEAAMLMLAFGLGTLPALFSITAFGLWLRTWQGPNLGQVSGVIVIALGLWTMYQGVHFYQIIRGLANW